MQASNDEATGFFQPILGDGRPLLLMTAGSLLFAGGFAIFLAATGEFLPQDIHSGQATNYLHPLVATPALMDPARASSSSLVPTSP